MPEKDFAKIVDLKDIESHLPTCAPQKKEFQQFPHFKIFKR